MASGDDDESAGPCQLLDGGEGDLQEAQSFPLAGAASKPALMVRSRRPRERQGGRTSRSSAGFS